MEKIWNKKIPSLLGILLITVGIIATSYLARQGIILITKAGPSEIPSDIKVTNITESSFTVTYQTKEKVFGSVTFGKDEKMGTIARDDKDQETNTLNSLNLHNITVRNLEPQTTYYFMIISGKKPYEDEVYKIKTGPKIDSEPSSQPPLTGKVTLSNGEAPKEAFVYATIEDAQAISARVKENGEYILPLNSLRTKDLDNYFSFSDDKIKMYFTNDEGLKSNVLVSIDQINPVPTITLSNSYDFSSSSEPVASDSGELGSFPTFSDGEVAAKNNSTGTKILFPYQENQGITDQQPMFKGKAEPNSNVKIKIHSPEEIEAEVKSDQYGNWSYRPSKPLSPGEHTISIFSRGLGGILNTISRNFTVFFSGTQVAEAATPSATPIERPTPTPTLVTVTPTLSPTVIPTIEPTAIIKSVTPTSELKPGSGSLVQLGSIGIGVVLFGILIFFLTGSVL